MRCVLHVKVMPFHSTGKAFALAGSGHIDFLDVGKLVDRHGRTHLQVALTTKLANETLRLTSGLVQHLNPGGGKLLRTLAFQLGDMATLTATGHATRLVLETQLNGRITVVVLTANLLADICYAWLDPRIVIGGDKA